MMVKMRKGKLLDTSIMVVYVVIFMIAFGKYVKVVEGRSNTDDTRINMYEYSSVEEIVAEEHEESNVADVEEFTYVSVPYELSDEECYILAKIAMAEAEGEDIEGKALVINVVLNRVQHDEFPDSVEEVIFEEGQFTPIYDGRWNMVEPNEECWVALNMVLEGWDESEGALFFESIGEGSWHWYSLKSLFKHGNHYFYTF